uniref:Uncharacterized protein n=1 Tax=Rhizophora mucronata TaxID=61149 RepID=A0A2P2M4B9_RHIMU
MHTITYTTRGGKTIKLQTLQRKLGQKKKKKNYHFLPSIRSW